MFKKMTRGSVKLVERFLPDAFIFCIILTIIAFVFSWISTGQTPLELAQHWGTGVWSLLSFSMQMALVLVLGNAFASSRPIKKALTSIAGLANTPTGAIMLVSVVSAVACWINWGFGLIVGALLAKNLAKRVKNVDYPLLIASAYSGFLVWHGGISGSIPLSLNTSNIEELHKLTGNAIDVAIPTSQTLFSMPNLILSVVLIAMLPIINRLMHPDADQTISINPVLLEDEVEPVFENVTPANKLENSRILSLIVVAIGVIFLCLHFINNGFDLNLNIVNTIFLILGILFHGTPVRYVYAIDEAVRGAGGILLQFPFYAGIMGLMTGANADGVSLASIVTDFFVNISTVNTFPMFSFWAAGIVNFFVPSGGGQMAVQGPIMLPASVKLGVDPAITAMAIAWGDAWTNMIQPFWALPALGIAGLKAKDIMGYCLMVLIASGIIISLSFLFLF